MKVVATIDGAAYTVSVGFDGYCSQAGLSAQGDAYVRSLLKACEAAKRLATSRLLSVYNNVWVDDDHPALSADDFAKRLSLAQIVILDTPQDATLYFDDGDLFGGHWVSVSMTDAVPKTAQLEG